MYIKAVAETASFSRAAEACFVTQPSLSNAIAQFEAEIGGQVFTRTTRRVDITPFGHQLLPLIEAVIDAKVELETSAKSYLTPSHKLLRIGLSPLVDIHLLTTVLEPFTRSNSDVEIVYKECFLDDMQRRLDVHKLDVVFAPDGFISKKHSKRFLYEDQLFYLPKSAKESSSPIYLKDIAAEVFAVAPDGCGLSNSIRLLFNENGLKFQEYTGQALSHQVLEDWADLGVAATILPHSKIQAKGRNAQLILLKDGKPALVKIMMLWNTKAAQPGHVGMFVQYVKSKVPSIMKGLGRI